MLSTTVEFPEDEQQLRDGWTLSSPTNHLTHTHIHTQPHHEHMDLKFVCRNPVTLLQCLFNSEILMSLKGSRMMLDLGNTELQVQSH